jgi:hypothetical protein
MQFVKLHTDGSLYNVHNSHLKKKILKMLKKLVSSMPFHSVLCIYKFSQTETFSCFQVHLHDTQEYIYATML